MKTKMTTINFFDYENEDLCKLTTEELQKRKDQMEKLYTKNVVNPNEKDFIYDVRKDFNEADNAEWDEDEDC